MIMPQARKELYIFADSPHAVGIETDRSDYLRVVSRFIGMSSMTRRRRTMHFRCRLFPAITIISIVSNSNLLHVVDGGRSIAMRSGGGDYERTRMARCGESARPGYWKNKSCDNGETFDHWVGRISGGDEEVADLIKTKKFLFGGRILANRGLEYEGKKITLSNCYVATPPEDSIQSIFDRAGELAPDLQLRRWLRHRYFPLESERGAHQQRGQRNERFYFLYDPLFPGHGTDRPERPPRGLDDFHRLCPS